MNDLVRSSKALSYWLRHKPDAGGLVLDDAGWTDTGAVLAALERAGLPGERDHLERVVAGNDKQRFEFSETGDRIRARQGHSVTVDAGWQEQTPPPFLYHGTVERFLASILAEGLLPQGRHHVHLSPDVETARSVGARRGKPVILAVRAQELHERGARFLLSANGVWLTEEVPPAYLSLV